MSFQKIGLAKAIVSVRGWRKCCPI